MKRGDFIDRGLAFAITLGFMTFVRPDVEPTRVEATIVAIMMYEAIRWCSWLTRRMQKAKRKKENERAMHYDGERWAEERLYWPIYEEVN
jgi:hypothetical protein